MSERNPSRRNFLWTIGAGASVAILGSDSADAKEAVGDRPNILWINCEDISPALGCYGDEFATTPNLDKLAKEGILYRRAYATAPICAPSRSCLITGIYATSLGTQHLRCEVDKPDFVLCLPEYLREHGYFTSNTGKTDYNFSPDGVWDLWTSKPAPWRQRKPGQPFFMMTTIGTTHEGSVNILERYKEATAGLDPKLRRDPAKVPVPPTYPDTPEIRRIWAGVYDLVTVMDGQVGEIIKLLEEDGLLDNSIIVFFSDHGFGLPRYKRWLNTSGLHVPLIVRIPPKYKHLAKTTAGEENDDLVSFVDFAPTVLNLAGVPIPDHMQGQTFLGRKTDRPRRYIYGARSRADDMYEVSRAIVDERYIYIRHYMPHLPFIQPGRIFSDVKRSYKELRRLHKEGKLEGVAASIWEPTKPIEELYDLEKDPFEQTNLADSPDHRRIKRWLRGELRRWILRARDTGFLPEAEYHIRAKDSTPYEMAQDPDQYNLPHILETAEMVGRGARYLGDLTKRLGDTDSGVRYWAAVGLQALGTEAGPAVAPLKGLLDDPSPSVQIAAAETLCHLGECDEALLALARNLQDSRTTVALQAARSLALIGDRSKPLVPLMYKVIEANKGPAAGGRYKDFNYAAFTTWALEEALRASGEPITYE